MLTDTLHRPLKDLRISVIDRCNFRCTYCMPEEEFGESYQFLRRSELLTFEEVTRIAQIGARLGVTKLRLTGGEPLLRPKLDQLVAMLAPIEGIDDLAITTNGVLLPQTAQALKDAGLKRVNVSLDSLDDAVFRQMNGNRTGVETVLAGIQAAQAAGFTGIKVNTVVQRGVNDHTLLDLVRYCKDHGLTVRFIEYMDVGTLNGWRLDQVLPTHELIALIDAEFPLEPVESVEFGAVAQRYRFRDGGGEGLAGGEIGVITSVTQPFCGDCTRLRLSAEGKLYTCLFGVLGVDVREPLRSGASDDIIADILRGTWRKRADRYSEQRASTTEPTPARVEMFHIGG